MSDTVFFNDSSLYADGKYQKEYNPAPRSFREVEGEALLALIDAAVNPAHYKQHLPPLPEGAQWLQTIWFKYGEAAYKSYCLITADKYLSRNGKKDNTLQEIKKAEWYLKAHVLVCEGKFHADGRPYLPDEV